MKEIIVLLIIYSVFITYLFLKKNKENKINYSNYKNALRALSEHDNGLAMYLKKKNETKRINKGVWYKWFI